MGNVVPFEAERASPPREHLEPRKALPFSNSEVRQRPAIPFPYAKDPPMLKSY